MKMAIKSLPLLCFLFAQALAFAPIASKPKLLNALKSSVIEGSLGASSTSGASVASSASGASTSTIAFDESDPNNLTRGSSTTTKFWKWNEHDIFTEVRSPLKVENVSSKPAVILLHGFAASTTYWRETMSALQREGYEVHALDLLGQGRSSKPVVLESNNDDETSGPSSNSIPDSPMEMGKNSNVKVEYSINLWAQLVDDYARHHKLGDLKNNGIVLMGNSLGSLVALSAATGDFAENEMEAYIAGSRHNDENGQQPPSPSKRIRGICLFNCAIGLNSRNVLKNPNYSSLEIAFYTWIFNAFNALIFGNKPLLRYALNHIVTQDLLRNALQSLYLHSPERVDDELVDSFYYPAVLDVEGAIESIRQIYTNDAGLTPMELHEKHKETLNSLPIHLVWGDQDVVTPLEGDVGTFYRDRVANNRGRNGLTTMDVVKGGHVPFDDNPEESHGAMLRWLEKKVLE